MYKIGYRKEIDGLRAIAVTAVIFYHARLIVSGQQIFKGGFIGVDIFFVISGYLITSIILKELITTNNFSFKFFYEKRIRRILPVLLLVILSSLPFAWIYLAPYDLVDYSKSIFYSLGFTSNYFFWHFDLNYFGNLIPEPFLHTWSLSVEEQFYILFPFILYFIFRYSKNYLIHILIFILVISFVSAVWTSKNYPSFAFYSLSSRIWELLAGSILSYFEIKRGYRNRIKLLNLFSPCIGLMLIGYSVFFFDNSIRHPSYMSLIPIAGTCLIIWFSNKDDIFTKILSSKIFVSIGLISYSLYLWHYPMFAFLKLSELASGDLFKKIIFFMLLIIISFFSYKFIENPTRNLKSSFKKILTVVILLYILISSCVFIIIKNEGVPKRFDYYKEINKNYNPDNQFLGKERMSETDSSKKIFKKDKNRILIIGDSLGQDLFNALKLNQELFSNIDFILVYEQMENVLLNHTQLLKDANRIVLSYRWTIPNLENLEKNIKRLKDLNKNIYLTSRTNEYEVNNYGKTILDKKIFSHKFNTKEKFDYFGMKNVYFKKRIIKSNSDINIKLKKFSEKEKLYFLNKEDYMCNILEKTCDYVDEVGNKIFFDYGHYTKEGARYFGKKIHKINWLKLN